ncbi:MAG TPA: ABC transporter ATP-binding protein [Candidatus Limnocylindrales bacterium]
MSALVSLSPAEPVVFPTAPVALRIEGVRKRYGPRGNGVLALADISLEVARGAFVCLVGASGCGKSTLLNLVAGLDTVDDGRIERQGRVGLLFQEAALFPWLTAAGNVELALSLRGVERTDRKAKARELLDLVNLSGFGDRRPHELSGGMRQRVALARALAQDADLLLMDEPFGSLDAMTRDLLHDELERLWLERGFTVLFVTHDVREAVRLGDEVVVLTSRPGRVAERFEVRFGRRGRAANPGVGALAAEITQRLRGEVRLHGRDR